MKACVLLALLGTAYAAATLSPLCELELDKGECGRSQQKWGFNNSTGKCELFSYSGCGGNDNRFDEKYACERACIDAQAGMHSVCFRPPQRGPCVGSFQRYYYDNSTQSCHPFVYGGCQSNGNNFESYVSCMKVCKLP
ncbi:boophilin-H2-like [Rhipicephalus sanguineus]|uniref:boophilin-H2-like n=1 Tax=Rhipicephalus sanguineus TaxID=34632 RepID=UPI001893D91C|nr:boophilin-H2-like [Rhipicephalus sanguineus]